MMTDTPLHRAAFERIMQGDRAFFEQRPERDYFIRAITLPEVAEVQSMGGSVRFDASVLVGNIAVGARSRIVFAKDSPPPIAEFREAKQAIVQKMGGKKSQKARSTARGFAVSRR